MRILHPLSETVARLRMNYPLDGWQVLDLTRQGQSALGEEEFAPAYAEGWELDAKTAMTAADPILRMYGTN